VRQQVAPTSGDCAWVDAALGRCLLAQDRSVEALEVFDDARSDAADGRAEVEAQIEVLAARVDGLVRAGRLFDAGLASTELATRAKDAHPTGRALAALAALRVVAASGDVPLAQTRFATLIDAARRERAPLLALEGRLVWVSILRQAGRGTDARTERLRCVRLSRVAPALLKRQTARVLAEPTPIGPSINDLDAGNHRLVLDLLRLGQDGDDQTAVAAIIKRIRRGLRAARVEIQSCLAGRLAALASSGSGTPPRTGMRAIETGAVIGPEESDGEWDAAVPVRTATGTVAALACRWRVGETAAPCSGSILEVGAACAAPRLAAILHLKGEAAPTTLPIPGMVGTSQALADLRRSIVRAAASPFAVLIEGESGTGKELVARAIHQLGPRRERRFCGVNSAALPDELLESELFGHTRGAFTGAVVERRGLFEEADGGTLFLDELAELSLRAQAKLLRVLQDGEVRRVGESFTRRVDVRIVTATNRSLADAVDAGQFRRDLLYRLDVIRIHIPPLRERPADIPLLARHFWHEASARMGTRAALAPNTLAALARYPWPGNIRELQNVMAALAVAAPPSGAVPASLLPTAILEGPAPQSMHLAEARHAFERRHLELALARAGGRRAQAARDLGLSRQGLLKLMARRGL
jgi:transcriptional regulator with AAA-type ATPase domain